MPTLKADLEALGKKVDSVVDDITNLQLMKDQLILTHLIEGEGIGSFLKKQKRKASSAVDSGAKTVSKGAKTVSRKTGAAKTTKDMSRYSKDKRKTSNLKKNVAKTAAESAAASPYETIEEAMGRINGESLRE